MDEKLKRDRSPFWFRDKDQPVKVRGKSMLKEGRRKEEDDEEESST